MLHWFERFLSKLEKFEKKNTKIAKGILNICFRFADLSCYILTAAVKPESYYWLRLEIDDFEGRTHARKLVTVDQFSRLRIPRGRAFVGSQTDCSHLLSIWLVRKWLVAAWNLRSINDELVWHSPLISLVAASSWRRINLSTLRLAFWSFLRWSARNSRV